MMIELAFFPRNLFVDTLSGQVFSDSGMQTEVLLPDLRECEQRAIREVLGQESRLTPS